MLKPYRSNGWKAVNTASITDGDTPRSAACVTNFSRMERSTDDFFLRIE